jgi:hypothetical protein
MQTQTAPQFQPSYEPQSQPQFQTQPQFQPQYQTQPQFQPQYQTQPQFHPQYQPQYQFQPQYQPQPQQVQQPAQQAAPVAPVANPTYTPAGGHPGQQQQNPAQQAMIAIARALEQAIPGYQIVCSMISDLAPTGMAGIESLLQVLHQSGFHHGVALGSIRRFLAGETTAGVINSLALNLNLLAKTHTQLRPQIERLAMSADPEQRAAITKLSQLLGTMDQALTQAGHATHSAMGQEAWDAVRAEVWGTTPAPAEQATT